MTNDKQQTGVQWFAFELSKLGLLPDGVPDDIYKQAKEMDREQKKHAYDWGETNGADECNGDGATHENFEQYYQETYGGSK
jgi:hypothetical protein